MVLIAPVFAFKTRHPAALQARMTLVNAGGLLERTFTAGRYAMQLSAEAYNGWRFADEALPADLIKRWARARPSIDEQFAFPAQSWLCWHVPSPSTSLILTLNLTSRRSAHSALPTVGTNSC